MNIKAYSRFLKIAILTASTGAAIRDIQSTINSRYPLAEKIQISTLVQGTQAKEDIIKILNMLIHWR